MEWLLELVLAVLLATTLFHALRLQRALGVLRRDRSALEEMVAGFNSSTRAAELGVERLREAADGAGRQIARQTESAQALKDDLQFLAERGERLADRLEGLVRGGRPPAPMLASEEPVPGLGLGRPMAADSPHPVDTPRLRSRAEQDLLAALRMAR